MKWTETVLVARRRSDGAFYSEWRDHGALIPEWIRSAVNAKRFTPGYELQSAYIERFAGSELVKLTITYEVEDTAIKHGREIHEQTATYQAGASKYECPVCHDLNRVCPACHDP